MIEDPIELSELGDARRERILQCALAVARARRYRRNLSRTAAVVTILLLAGSLFFTWGQPDRRTPQPVHLIARAPARPESAVSPAIDYIQTDPAIVHRLSIAPGPPAWKTITDDELLQALADSGQQAGIIYHNGHAQLLLR